MFNRRNIDLTESGKYADMSYKDGEDQRKWGDYFYYIEWTFDIAQILTKEVIE